ncbi:apolipoprotein N-acyltransferase [Actibacterium ureilyticum]|uniref:apolipoprotein N-acyltransferase n=1 Tax=Actibacterium ureilyticum TaxID=1590614 RepID=UPI001FE49082|nr:apolipoprotein N-acyltransferase [Actibacterium ureilyticum]
MPAPIAGKRPRLMRAAFCLLAGLVAAAGQAPFHLWWLALPAWAFALWQIRDARDLKQAAFRGWLVGAGYVLATHHWIVSPFFVDAARHGWMAPFALLAMVSGIALFFGAAYVLAFWLGRGPVTRVLALIPALTLTELGRAYVLTGFPWALIGSLWVGQPLAQASSVIGPHGLVFLTLAIAALLVAFRGRGALVAGAGAVVLFGLATGYGMQRLQAPVAQTGKTVRIVQPNAAQHLKWRRDMVDLFFTRQLDLTAQSSERPLDLILWPETAIAYGLSPDSTVWDLQAEAAQGVPLLFGVQRSIGRRWYNSLAAIGADGGLLGTYDKHHLVPFGEYVPYGDVLELIGISSFAAQAGNGYSAGPGAEVLAVPGIGKVLPLICYEAIFPQDVGAAQERADLLIQVTNDAWFGGTVMPRQHLDQARLRAVEQGLPVARSANTGISAMIDPYGRVVAALPYGQAGALDAALPAPLLPTVYARTGDWPILPLLVVGFALLALRRRANTG